MLADVAACRAVEALQGSGRIGSLAAGDTVVHYLRPVKVGPVEARCQVLGGGPGRTVVRVAIHDVGADDRLVTLGSVAVLDV
jgi:acyl-coenzyme A thioesterase PaaI-like protein